MSDLAKSAVATATKKYGVLGALFYSRMAVLIAPTLIRCRITPNTVTVTGFALFILGCWTLSTGSGLVAVGGFAILHLGVVFDYADGIVARATKKSSFFGSWLDNCSDRAADFVVTLLVGMAIAKQGVLSVGCSLLLTGAGIFLMMFMHYIHDIGYFFRLSEAGQASPPAKSVTSLSPARIAALWLTLCNRDTLVLVLSVALVLTNPLPMFVAVLAILSVNVLLLSAREFQRRVRL